MLIPEPTSETPPIQATIDMTQGGLITVTLDNGPFAGQQFDFSSGDSIVTVDWYENLPTVLRIHGPLDGSVNARSVGFLDSSMRGLYPTGHCDLLGDYTALMHTGKPVDPSAVLQIIDVASPVFYAEGIGILYEGRNDFLVIEQLPEDRIMRSYYKKIPRPE